jgi:hypothetical protein
MLNQYLEVANIHIKRADNAIKTICLSDFSVESFENENSVLAIDSFIFRYLKLQDHLGSKLFPEVLKKVGEYSDSMPLIDVLDKLEKISLIPSSEKWMNYRDIRNQITHEYSNNKLNMLDNTKQAMSYFNEIKTIIEKLEKYIKDKKL